MTHTIPEDDFTSLEGMQAWLTIPSGVPGYGSGTNPSLRMDFIMTHWDGEEAPWREDPQYVIDLLTEALDAAAAKIATDYPLADPASYTFKVFKSKGF